MDLHENFTTNISIYKEKLIKLRKSSALNLDPQNFQRIIQQFGSYLWKSWSYHHEYNFGQSWVKVSRNAPECNFGARKFKAGVFQLQNYWISEPEPTFLGPAS